MLVGGKRFLKQTGGLIGYEYALLPISIDEWEAYLYERCPDGSCWVKTFAMCECPKCKSYKEKHGLLLFESKLELPSDNSAFISDLINV